MLALLCVSLARATHLTGARALLVHLAQLQHTVKFPVKLTNQLPNGGLAINSSHYSRAANKVKSNQQWLQQITKPSKLG